MAVKKCLGNKLYRIRKNLGLDEIEITAMKLIGNKDSSLEGHGRQRRVDKPVITLNNLELITRLTRSLLEN